MKKLKAISIFVLCFALLFSSTITASAAQSAKAATLRLEKTQGTVTVTNASGTNKKATQNMKLLSGYTVSTGKASYAYISLDDSKAIKLDASSKVSVHKAGKKTGSQTGFRQGHVQRQCASHQSGIPDHPHLHHGHRCSRYSGLVRV